MKAQIWEAEVSASKVTTLTLKLLWDAKEWDGNIWRDLDSKIEFKLEGQGGGGSTTLKRQK